MIGSKTPETQSPKYGSVATLARRYDTSVSTIWRWAAAGLLPKPIQLGPNTTRWDIEAADAAVARRGAA